MKASFLSHFTPSMMAPETLEAIFVQREALAQRLVELVCESVMTPAKHHTLLIGPRGSGKTHLVALAYHRVLRRDDLRERLLIAWLREEEWGITSFLDLLLRIFRALQAEHPGAVPDERVEALYNLSPAAAEQAGAALLKEIAGEHTLLLLMENLDDMFDGLGDEGQKRLRAYLQENPFITIVATAQSLFNGVSLQTSPFYGFFRIHHLPELSLDDATHLLEKIADWEGDGELKAFVPTPVGRARIRAVYHLAGGSYRVFVIFSQFINRETLDESVEAVMRTLDDLTPFYQARMAWLSPQQRKIVELLTDRRGAVPVKEIAQRCFMSHQTASSQLKDLRDKGYVASTTVGRESYYDLREPLMRLCAEVKKHRGEPVRLLVDFLRLWYSREELGRWMGLLPSDAALSREYLHHALRAAEEDTEDPDVAARLKNYEGYIETCDFARALEVTEELVEIRGNARDWLRQGYCLDELGRYDKALASCVKALELDPNDAIAWSNRGMILHYLRRYNEALTCFNRAIELDVNGALVLGSRGLALRSLGGYDQVLTYLDRAIELDANDALAWGHRGLGLMNLGRFNEALSSMDKAIELNPNYARAWSRRGIVLMNLGCYGEALASCDKAIELNPNYARGWARRGSVLMNFGRYSEALASFNKAIELGCQFSHIFLNRAVTLLVLDRWNEGVVALDDALSHFARADERIAGDAGAIVSSLITITHDMVMWRERGAKLIQLYDKYQALPALARGLVESIKALQSPLISDAAAEKWRDIWQELAGGHKEFEIPLRLLDAAVRYRASRDPRVLLELAPEERAVLKEVLPGEEPTR